MERENFSPGESFVLFSDEDGNDLWRGRSLKELRHATILTFVLPTLFALLIPVMLILQGVSVREAFGDWAWLQLLLVGFSAVTALMIAWQGEVVSFRNGIITRRKGRFPPHFETTELASKFNGVRFWFDADGGIVSEKFLQNKHNGALGAYITVELSHAESEKTMVIFRGPHDSWYPEDQLYYAKKFGLPVFVPGAADYPRYIYDDDKLESEVFFESRRPDETPHLDNSTVQVEHIEKKGDVITYPYAPFDWVNTISVTYLLQVFIGVATIFGGRLYKNDWDIASSNAEIFLPLLFLVVVVTFGLSWTLTKMKRHVEVTDTHFAASFKAYRRQPRVRFDEIIGFCVGRRLTWASWQKGTYALWAIKSKGSVPIAIGMSEQTYWQVLNACKSILRDHAKKKEVSLRESYENDSD